MVDPQFNFYQEKVTLDQERQAEAGRLRKLKDQISKEVDGIRIGVQFFIDAHHLRDWKITDTTDTQLSLQRTTDERVLVITVHAPGSYSVDDRSTVEAKEMMRTVIDVLFSIEQPAGFELAIPE